MEWLSSLIADADGEVDDGDANDALDCREMLESTFETGGQGETEGERERFA